MHNHFKKFQYAFSHHHHHLLQHGIGGGQRDVQAVHANDI
jgi:hypothetical protein